MVLCAKAAPGTAKAKEKKKKKAKNGRMVGRPWQWRRGRGSRPTWTGSRWVQREGRRKPSLSLWRGGLRAGISDFGREGRAHCLRSALGRGLRATLTGAPHSGISETYWRAKAASHSFLFRSLAAPGFAAVARLDNLKSPSRPIPPRNLPLAAPFQRRNC